MINQFYIDKSLNVIYEGLMEEDIRTYYALRGLRVNVYENPANDQKGLEEYDRRASTGDLWECKQDRIWGTTGNVFLEIPHPYSKATHFLIKTFRPTAFRRHTFLSILDAFPHRQAGDYGRAEGILVPIDELFKLSEYYPIENPPQQIRQKVV